MLRRAGRLTDSKALGAFLPSECHKASPRLSSCFSSSLALLSFPLVLPSPITPNISLKMIPKLVFPTGTLKIHTSTPADHLALTNLLTFEHKISKSNQVIISFTKITTQSLCSNFHTMSLSAHIYIILLLKILNEEYLDCFTSKFNFISGSRVEQISALGTSDSIIQKTINVP